VPLHPQARAALDRLAARGGAPLEQTLDEYRAAFLTSWAELSGHEEVARVEDRVIPGPEGEIPIRVYDPGSTGGPRPIVVSLHSGGFILGGIPSNDGIARAIANRAAAIVVSPDYGLAPERPFPSGVEDCYATASWVHGHAEELGGDPSQLAVQGCSAGANLAIATALLAKRRGGPPLVLQVLAYPPTDATESQPSVVQHGEGPVLTRAMIRLSNRLYLGDRGLEREPLVSPIFADDLDGMPPCVLFTAEYDPLRDEGELYGRQLAAAGVEVTVRRYDGMMHGWFEMPTAIDAARVAIDEACGALRRAFATSGRR
jgi:acetyl esterase